MKILQYIRLHIKNSITQIAYYNTFHVLGYARFRIAKCFVFKHTETIEHVKKYPTFYEKNKLYGRITREFLGFRMRNFQDIIFI